MRRAPVLLACLAWMGLLAAGAPAARADEQRDAALRNFVRDRDVERVYLALEALGEPPAGAVMRLLDMARGRVPESLTARPEARGRAALPEVVAALHHLDLDCARRAVARADDGEGGMAAAWVGALVRVRSGDDAGAVGRLLAPPLFAWDRDAFDLALLGAALPGEDRIMLEAAARAALQRAAARGRVQALSGTALALAALHPEAGRQACVLAVRALRRHGNAQEAERLMGAAAAAGVPRRWPALALEDALTAWEAGRTEEVASKLAGVTPPAGAQASFLALRRARRRGPALDTGPGLEQATGAKAQRLLIARFATALGVPTGAEDVERWAERLGEGAPSPAALAGRYLEHRGFVVLRAAGDSAAGDAALAAGYPFLVMLLTRRGSDYEEVTHLVRGFDRRTGLWLLDEPRMGLLDVLPRSAAAKARLLVAVPAAERALLAPFAGTPAARLAGAVEEALDVAERDGIESALTRLRGLAGPGAAVARLCEARLLFRRALAENRDDLLSAARRAVESSRRVAPLLGFEAYVRGQALVTEGDRVGGLAAYDRVERLEGPSETLAMARFVALERAGQRTAAREALDVARRLAPLVDRVLVLRAAARVKDGEFEAARADLRRALDRRPETLTTSVALASLELDAGRPAVALDVLRETARRDPTLASHPLLRYRWRLAERRMIEQAETVEALQPLRRSPEADTRRRLAFELAARKVDGPDAEALLRTLLADDDDGVRASTLRLYMRPWLRERVESDPVLGRRVCLMLEKDEAPNVREAATALLGRVDAPFGIRALAACLSGLAADGDPDVRSAAARALGAHDSPAAREVLVAALDDVAVSVREAAVQALFQIAATTHGFEADGEPAARAAALEKWRAWLAEGR